MKTIYTYLALVALIATLYACKKELSALPKNAKVDANTILDQGTAQIALNGAYYRFANATAIKTGWQNHQIKPPMFAGYIGMYSSVLPEEENRNDRATNSYWDESYMLLNAVNGVLKGVNSLSDTQFTGNRKKEIMAEARFLRAYAHFKLLTFYGEWYKPESQLGALLRDEISTLSYIPKKRSTVKESYDFILADLDNVIANGPAASPTHYATKWAGMALKMRVLMSRGSGTDYGTIVTLANTLIQESPYKLEPIAEDVFHKKGLSSQEVILGIKPQANQEKETYSTSAQYWPGASSLYVARAPLKSLYANDPRQAWIIGSARPKAGYFFFTKYMKENGVSSALSETYYVLRLTEVYLLKAEAIVRSGGSLADAKAVVHEIQAKAGITTASNNTSYLAVENAGTSAALVMEIFKETVKSLIAEDGMEWMAMLRLPFDTVKQLKPTIANQSQYILPVPKDEFLYNPIFGDQNPGYAKN
ncbi:RagB/SusD family nutrient uptake outer membrane protein [Pedobacter psychroterrae]|uniref:RagB/SusD family nutrient uptake outer membrane protein n=1 Tax=Pedobacter psychroterrae TaxID=2530453 RepID=A0A4R0NRV4_9SPHI|nr:RagB/SusD family nutrient uptake outer membrane protein [Pedobacter psychroterrae]TCD02849.1 RagB/SusD family nutrient uptake outer membrane protein [Pedobacter psychroterrae]